MKKFLALNVTLAALFVASSVIAQEVPTEETAPVVASTVVADSQVSVSDQIAPPAPAMTSDCVGCAQSAPSFASVPVYGSVPSYGAAPCNSCGQAAPCSTCAAPAPCTTCAAPVRRLPLRRNNQTCSTCCAPAVQPVSYQQPCSTCAQPAVATQPCSTCATGYAPAVQTVSYQQPCTSGCGEVAQVAYQEVMAPEAASVVAAPMTVSPAPVYSPATTMGCNSCGTTVAAPVATTACCDPCATTTTRGGLRARIAARRACR